MLASVRSWLDERVGYRGTVAAWRAPIDGGPSLAHTLGFTLALLLAVQAISGTLLALYYSPSTSSAWASVAYVEDQVTLGSFVRGVHRWGMSAVVIVAGLHLIVTAIRGGYRRPREVQWWIGLALIGVMIGYSISGFVLRWDQYGYWATKVELGYAEDAPGGRALTQAIQGGNEFGNLTLTRFYALHVVVLPVITLLLGAAYRAQSRRHGVVPAAGTPRPAWPHQSLRNWLVGAVALVGLGVWSVHAGGAGLDAPADPTAAYDARPQWYFRPLFALVNSFGSLRTFMALGVPAIALGALALVPFVDGRPGRPRRHALVLAMLGLGLAGAVVAGWTSYAKDDADANLAQRNRAAAADATRARTLARTYGVPAPGGTAVFTTPRFHTARTLWARECASCHEGDDRKAPLIGPGFGGRAHLRSLITDASAPEHFGRSPKITGDEGAMPKTVILPAGTIRAPKADDEGEGEGEGASDDGPAGLTPEELDAVVELIYAETGALDVDLARAERGKAVFDDGPCADCHARTGTDASSGPNLAGYGSRRYWEAILRDAGAANLFGKLDDMPAYDDDLRPDELRAIAEYLVWLRTATAADVTALPSPP